MTECAAKKGLLLGILIFIVIVALALITSCASPYNAGVCTVNDRLLGEC